MAITIEEFTAAELEDRRRRFVALMESRFPDWNTAVFIDNTNQYYFTGTMQNGVLFIYKDGSFLYGVRRSYDRAMLESPLAALPGGDAAIVSFSTYRDLIAISGAGLGNVYVSGDTMPAGFLERLKKYYSMDRVGFLDSVIQTVRSVKSPAEITRLRLAGEQHRVLLEERVPRLLREGMSEAEFLGELTCEMFRLGHQGLARFHQPQVEIAVGQIGFGTNALYPSWFDGPGGTRGNSAFAPFSADPARKLRKGDAVFVDTPLGVGGYQSDKTQVYFFGSDAPEAFREAHDFCLNLERRIAERLKPGEVPSKIYGEIMASLSEKESDCFMGIDNRHRVKFLGHGVGLNVDEFPVIAQGFDEPLEENMVLAVEPKKGVAGIGMAGVEDTFIVKPSGGECITGGGREVIRVS
jgi:Xaa-Pro aminopeptidase